jgi:hypothetical protein
VAVLEAEVAALKGKAGPAAVPKFKPGKALKDAVQAAPPAKPAARTVRRKPAAADAAPVAAAPKRRGSARTA